MKFSLIQIDEHLNNIMDATILWINEIFIFPPNQV
jgi:hypothetical protein